MQGGFQGQRGVPRWAKGGSISSQVSAQMHESVVAELCREARRAPLQLPLQHFRQRCGASSTPGPCSGGTPSETPIGPFPLTARARTPGSVSWRANWHRWRWAPLSVCLSVLSCWQVGCLSVCLCVSVSLYMHFFQAFMFVCYLVDLSIHLSVCLVKHKWKPRVGQEEDFGDSLSLSLCLSVRASPMFMHLHAIKCILCCEAWLQACKRVSECVCHCKHANAHIMTSTGHQCFWLSMRLQRLIVCLFACLVYAV